MRRIYIPVLIVILSATLLVTLSYPKLNSPKIEPKIPDQTAPSIENSKKVEGVIRFFSENDKTEYNYNVEDKSTVFELMKALVQETKINFEYQESDMGVFIESINGIKNDTANNKYWMLYVNDKLSPVGASEYKLSTGDIVEWRYLDTSQMKF